MNIGFREPDQKKKITSEGLQTSLLTCWLQHLLESKGIPQIIKKDSNRSCWVALVFLSERDIPSLSVGH